MSRPARVQQEMGYCFDCIETRYLFGVFGGFVIKRVCTVKSLFFRSRYHIDFIQVVCFVSIRCKQLYFLILPV